MTTAADPITDLRTYLQDALQVEWTTIPPYLCALWSIEDGYNVDAATAIHDVVMEEMLHMTLVANLLNALGGQPSLGAGTVPSYPTSLPGSNDAFQISLLPLSPDALTTFLEIERPAPATAPPEGPPYETIAQFYEFVRALVKEVGSDPGVWTGNPEFQVGPGQYYGGGGAAFPITGLESAREALDLIIDEGEGIHEGLYDGDAELLGEPRELAHYWRFNELALGRHYGPGDTPASGPTGPPLLIDYDKVRPMMPNPKSAGFPPGSDVRTMMDDFTTTYTGLVGQLESAFNGAPDTLQVAVTTMYSLKYKGVALMNVPVGDGLTAGPTFEYGTPS